MADISISRAHFTAGVQRKFLQKALVIVSVSKLAQICSCSERTIRDWRREKFSISVPALMAIAKELGIPIPVGMVIVQTHAHLKDAAKRGGNAVVKKYGRVPINTTIRAQKWREWWESKGKHLPHPIFDGKPVELPGKDTALAEFVGIVMGDGGMTRYQIKISLNSSDDALYIQFVTNLMRSLFRVLPGVYPDKKESVTDIVISRKNLVGFLNDLGLPIGNKLKSGLDIPDWIKKDKGLSIACVRGLIDTDGCIFTHRYTVKGKRYAYKKLSFTSASPALLESVYALLISWGMRPRVGSNRDVRLESSADIGKYFKLVGTHNPKHLRRYGI